MVAVTSSLWPIPEKLSNPPRSTIQFRSSVWLSPEASAADALNVPKSDSGEIEIYSVEEMKAPLKHADKHALPMLCLGGFAGLRTAEIERLTWSR